MRDARLPEDRVEAYEDEALPEGPRSGVQTQRSLVEQDRNLEGEAGQRVQVRWTNA